MIQWRKIISFDFHHIHVPKLSIGCNYWHFWVSILSDDRATSYMCMIKNVCRQFWNLLILLHDNLSFFFFFEICLASLISWLIMHLIVVSQWHKTSWQKTKILKPQDSFGEFNSIFFLIFRKCRKSSENTIRPSCNCFEWHILLQYCPVANYHYTCMYITYGKVFGGTPNILMFWIFPDNGSISEWTVSRALIVHTTL